MKITKELSSFDELMENSWSGAIARLETIQEHNKEDEFMELLEDIFFENVPTDTELNDFIWFEDEYYMEFLGINEDDE